MKTCNKCKEEKELSEFYKNKRKKGGLSRECKECTKRRSKQYYQDNKENATERHRSYYQDNKEKIAEQQKQYYRANKEKIAEQQKQYYQANREAIKACAKQYAQDNREAIQKYQKQYRQDNKEVLAEYDRHRNKNPSRRASRAKSMALYYLDNKEKFFKANRRRRHDDPAAIYEIRNKVNEKVYIGQTTAKSHRISNHKSALRGGIHDNKMLQLDYDKHGEDAFEFSVVREFQCDAPKELLIEQESIEMAIRVQRGETLYNSQLPSTELLKCDLELLESAITEFEHPIDHLQMIIETCNSQNVPLQLGLLALKQIKERE